MSQTVELELVVKNPAQKQSKLDGTEYTPSPEPMTDAASMGDHAEEGAKFSKSKTFCVISSVTSINIFSTFIAGLLTVAIPTIAADIQLDQSLILWPSSVYALVCGCTLLIAGSASDAIGARLIFLVGSLSQAIFTLACGLSRTGSQMIAFRALSGLALSFCLPTSVSIITSTFPAGKRRNVAFASMGGGQPIGFSLGLTLGGVLTDTIGWRWGFYGCAFFNIILFLIATWGLPKDKSEDIHTIWKKVKADIDWIGAIIASASLAMISYVLAALTSDSNIIKKPSILIILIISVVLMPIFVVWVSRQERLERPALVPNSFWRNRVFTTTCLCVFVTWGSFNATEQMINFFFQYVQKLSPLAASERFLPEPISGTMINIMIGLIVHRTSAYVLVITGTLVTCAPPLLMALANPGWIYWAAEFPSVLLMPVGSDIWFTVATLLITSNFSKDTQGLAGGVFNTVTQIGKSVGLALSAVIANNVTADSSFIDKASAEALLEGYRAAFWFCFALNIGALVLSVWGLKKVGKVGQKQD